MSSLEDSLKNTHLDIKSRPPAVSDTDDEEPGAANESDEEGPEAKAMLQSEKAIKSGYLLKKGEKRKTWKKRWFVLRSTKIAYYKDEKEYKLLHVMDLQDVHTVEEVKHKDKQNVFVIVTPARTYFIRADSRPIMESWISAINGARAQAEKPREEQEEDEDERAVPNIITNPTQPVVGILKSTTAPQPITIPVATPSESADPSSHPVSSYSSGGLVGSRDPYDPNMSSEDDDDFASPVQDIPPHLLMDDDRVLHQGYLNKMRRNKTWKKRWFVLRSSRFSYYRNDRELQTPRRSVPLLTILDAMEIDPTAKSKTPYCFKVVGPKRSLILCADREEEMQAWLEALNLAIRKAKRKASQHSDSAELETIGSSTAVKG
ncbi:uncharacterized protein VTP21DRAFT_1312 [Calcarisporiella thermophila]|uniref:uncharacterized protein n=1 Tax=Calcarisporiella thermophila TaxID=911321 RepID=UPI00374247A6